MKFSVTCVYQKKHSLSYSTLCSIPDNRSAIHVHHHKHSVSVLKCLFNTTPVFWTFGDRSTRFYLRGSEEYQRSNEHGWSRYDWLPTLATIWFGLIFLITTEWTLFYFLRLADTLVFWIPIIYELMIGLLLFCQAPIEMNGSAMVFKSVIQPMLGKPQQPRLNDDDDEDEFKNQ